MSINMQRMTHRFAYIAFAAVILSQFAFVATAHATWPTGYFDYAGCESWEGWAYDPDYPGSETSIHFYIDGPAGSGWFGTSAGTSVYRGDVNGAYGLSGNHGFYSTVPNSLRDGQVHSIYPHVIDLNGDPNIVIYGAPRNIQCSFQLPTCSISFSPAWASPNQTVTATVTYYNHPTTNVVWTNPSMPTSVGGTTSYGYNPQYQSIYITPSATTNLWIQTGNGAGTSYCIKELPVYQSCTFNGSTVVHGNSVTAYQASTVPYGSSCASQTRTCSNGSLSGSYAYSSCSVSPPTPPAAPTNLTFSCPAPGTQATINWTPVSGATGYYIRINNTANGWAPACNGQPNDGYPGDICTGIVSGIPPYNYTTTAGGSYSVWIHAAGPGGSSEATAVSGTCTNPAPTCTVNVSPTSYNAPSSATLTWTSTNATTVYIDNYGYTATANGNTTVSPGATTVYNGTATGPGGTVSCTGNRTLTVNQSCTAPWGSTVTHGTSVTAQQAFTVPYGSSCVSQSRTCTNGSLSGTYQYATCTVNPPANCTLNGVTVNHGNSQTFYATQSPPAGQFCASSSYSQLRTCTNGTLSGSSAFQYATCSCIPQTTYSCVDSQTIASTTVTAGCGQSTTNTTCVAPSFCSGASTCTNPSPVFNQGTGTGTEGESIALSGHLQIRPSVIAKGTTTAMYWNISGVQSCTVTGNGRVWTTVNTGSTGTTTYPITQQTVFTLSCTPYSGSTFTPEIQTVSVLPVFQEN